MSNIEVGEYIRTKDGRIEKVKVINKYGIIHKHDNDNDTFDTGINWYAESGREINEEDIKVHSKNIIDLIEVGDYVNGFYVIKVGIINEFKEKYVELFGAEKLRYNEDIRSIVTKEQFKEMEYRINE